MIKIHFLVTIKLITIQVTFYNNNLISYDTKLVSQLI